MTKRSSSSYAEKVSSTSGRFVKPTDKCNELLVHEHRKWELPSLENLKHNRYTAVNAAYLYLIGVRRLVDPIIQPAPKKWYIYMILAFIAGAIGCYYAFLI